MFAVVFKAIEDVTSYKVGIIGGNILASRDMICALATIVDVDIDEIIRKKVEKIQKIIKAGEKVLGILEKIKKDLERLIEPTNCEKCKCDEPPARHTDFLFAYI